MASVDPSWCEKLNLNFFFRNQLYDKIKSMVIKKKTTSLVVEHKNFAMLLIIKTAFGKLG
jgi:hypothetical protein